MLIVLFIKMELKIYNPTMDNALKHIDWNFEELKKEEEGEE